MVRQVATARDRLHAYVDTLSDSEAERLLGSLAGGGDQAYFWTEAWQEGERETDEDLAAGRVYRARTAEEARRYLLSEDDA